MSKQRGRRLGSRGVLVVLVVLLVLMLLMAVWGVRRGESRHGLRETRPLREGWRRRRLLDDQIIDSPGSFGLFVCASEG